MRSAHTVEQVRAAEAARMAELPDGALMQQAASGLAHAVAAFLSQTYGARLTLLVGSGDNGGDALWAGAFLARRGAVVEAVLLSPDRTHPEGLAAFVAAGGRVVRAEDARRPDVLVDGVVGIGGSGGLRAEALDALAHLAGVPVVAVDVPSGVDVDTGEVHGEHVRADLTVTFGTHKVAHLVDPAAAACGAVHLVDLGLDLPAAAVEAVGADDVAVLVGAPDADGTQVLPRRRRSAHRVGRLPRRRGALGGGRERPRRHGPLRRLRRGRGAGCAPGGRRRRRPGAGVGGRVRVRGRRAPTPSPLRVRPVYRSSWTPTRSATSSPGSPTPC